MGKRRRKQIRHLSKKGRTTFLGSMDAFMKHMAVFLCWVAVPSLIAWLVFQLKPGLVSEYSAMRISGVVFENGSVAVKEVISPFFSCVLLVVSVALAERAMCLLVRFSPLKKHFELAVAKKWVFAIEVIIVMLSAFVLFYSHAIGFEYWHYGIDPQSATNTAGHIPLMLIPSVTSYGVNSPSASPAYYLLMSLAQSARSVIDNLDLYLAICSALVIPLRIRIAKTEVV